MRISHKVSLVMLSSICLVFFSQITFAQNNNALKSEVYSKLKCCACQVSFDKCSCPEAKEMKAYIDALLESGTSKEGIFYKVAKKFSLKIIQDEGLRQNIEKGLISEAGQKRPQLIFAPASFDFERVNKKQGKISKTFKLSNKGNSPLIIKNLKTSCPCATASLKVNKKKTPYFGTEGVPRNWQIEIRPGETGELELMVDLRSEHVKIGKLIREALIFSNDPVYPEVVVKVEAEVNE
jgi:hypothetical protein